MSRSHRRALAAAAVALLAVAAPAVVASAHYVFTAGAYRVAIGWEFEPSSGTDTYVDAENAIQVFVDTASAGGSRGSPVSTLNADCSHPDLQVTVTVGGTTSSPFCPSPAYDADTGSGRRDEYDYPLIPTAVGAYTFHIFGSIAGTPIDRTVTSGPETFDSVGDASAVEFPVAVPPVSALATKVEAVNQRATDAVADARTSSSGAMTIALVAIVLSLVLGGASLVFSLRRRSTERCTG